MSDGPNIGRSVAETAKPLRLREALWQARIEAADRTGVVIDLRDAEVARLEILNEALDPLFAQVPDQIDLFDRGLSKGDTPRLWIDIVAHVLMGRDKRLYRFVQDTRHGRIVLAESRRLGRDRQSCHGLCRSPHDRARACAIGAAAVGASGGEKAAPRALDIRVRIYSRCHRAVRLCAIRSAQDSVTRGTAIAVLERFRAKWNPVRVKKTRQIKNLVSFTVFVKR